MSAFLSWLFGSLVSGGTVHADGSVVSILD